MTVSSRPLWLAPQPLLLASTSEARRAVLKAAGIPADVQGSGVDERAIEAAHEHLGPSALAERLAAEKALAVSRRSPGRIVVGADQVLDAGGLALHKPGTREVAARHLSDLAGRPHALRSAVAVARDGSIVEAFVESAHLHMRPLSEDAIARYLDAVPPAVLQNAGVYQVEDIGVHLFERIEGDHSTILGLPILPLLAALRRLGCLGL
ncbi:MAG TPA: nucleoside triphosphate pyrophosphatase [Microvirga sp.]|jgi:septum formation protein